MGTREIIAERDTTTVCPYQLSVAPGGDGGPGPQTFSPACRVNGALVSRLQRLIRTRAHTHTHTHTRTSDSTRAHAQYAHTLHYSNIIILYHIILYLLYVHTHTHTYARLHVSMYTPPVFKYA